MNLSLRKQYPRLVKIHEQPMRPTWVFLPSRAEAESTYRESCITFLDACFHGATWERLQELARQMWAKREAADHHQTNSELTIAPR